MDYPDPNPHFPPPPRTKSLPMGPVTIALFALAVLCLLGAYWMVKVPPVFTGLLLAATACMIAAALAFLNYRKHGAWRNGQILPALVEQAPSMSLNQAGLATAATATIGVLTSTAAIATIDNMIVLRTWYRGRERTLTVYAGNVTTGDVVWVIRRRNVFEVSNLLKVAAPKEFRNVEVDGESAMWLLKRVRSRA
jgi:hypothetical protein